MSAFGGKADSIQASPTENLPSRVRQELASLGTSAHVRRSLVEDGGPPTNLLTFLDQDALSAMDQDEALPVSVVALRAEAYTTDGNSIVISFRTKFSSAERKYSVPIECFHDLIIDLQRLNSSNSAERSIPDDARIAAE